MRAGTQGLAVFSYSLHATVLRAHAAGPLQASELEEAVGWAPQSSLRVAMGNLQDLGVIGRPASGNGAPSVSTTELTPSGQDLLGVADALELWLQNAPDGPIALDSAAARGTIRILTAGWDSRIIKAIAKRPLTLSELSAGIESLSYPAVKRRLSKLRSTSLVVPIGRGRAATYAASEWMRQAIVPLTVAGRWERRHNPGADPVSRLEVEAAFLLALPLLELAGGVSGACALVVMTAPAGREVRPKVAGVVLEIREGKVVSCTSAKSFSPQSWALGTTDAWLDAVLDGKVDALRIQGDQNDLPLEVVRHLHEMTLPQEVHKIASPFS